MAYPTVTDQCLDENHDACPKHVNTPADPNLVGGGFCICPCHGEVKRKWYEEVRVRAEAARRAADLWEEISGRNTSIPFLCRFHLYHYWTRPYVIPVHHLGEYPWDDWQHVCQGLERNCTKCGKRRRLFWKRKCYGGWVVRLPRQPHTVTYDEYTRACNTLLRDD